MNKETREELAEKFENGTIEQLGPKDKFKFQCTACGHCCFDISVMVNPMDVYLMARSLMAKNTYRVRWTHDLLVKRLVSLSRGPSSLYPVASLRFTTPGKNGTPHCPFLIPKGDHDMSVLHDKSRMQVMAMTLVGDTKFVCGLHEEGLKPMICRLSPLGRARRIEVEKGESQEMVFWQPISGCPGVKSSHEHVVDEYMEAAGINRLKKYSDRWFSFVGDEANRSVVSAMSDDICKKLGLILFDLDFMMTGCPDKFPEGVEIPSQVLGPDEYFDLTMKTAEGFVAMAKGLGKQEGP